MKNDISPRRVYKAIRKRVFLKIDNAFFLRRKSPDFFHIPGNVNGILLIATAFNNEELISYQYKFLKRYFNDPFFYLVADNSSDTSRSKAIRTYCLHEGIGYIRIPSNPYSKLDGSLSHGLALNWLYRNIVLRLNPKYFGFIDHDIFPIARAGIVSILEHTNVYGMLQEKPNKDNLWYLWAGFLFFKSAWVDGKNLNFLPSQGFDTNGANAVFLRDIDKTQMITDVQTVKVGSNPDLFVQQFGGWLHFTWSYDAEILKKKLGVLREYLNKRLLI